MEQRAHQVSYWFCDQLAPIIESSRWRRVLIPWLIVFKVALAGRRGERFSVVEIHEPLAGPYALLARLAGSGILPPCIVLSYGLEERAWAAEREHLRKRGRRPTLKSRISVPVTLLSQARLALHNASAIIVPSSADRTYLLEKLCLPSTRVICAWTGVSEELFAVERTPSPSVRMLFVGSWIERKGTLELTEAWRRVAAEYPTATLTVAGTGDQEAAILGAFSGSKVDVRPTILRKELPKLLSEHDIFVLPSYFEGMPLSMLEAAAAGLSCVVCALCGNLDVFRPDDPERDGALLIPPHDPDALYCALRRLLEDDALRAKLGDRARQRVRGFTWKHTADQCLLAYRAATY